MQVPRSAVAAIRERGLRPDDLSVFSSGRLVHLRADDLVLTVASGPQHRATIAAEVRGRTWAHAAGIGTPGLLAQSQEDGWILSRYVPPAPVAGAAYVQSAMAVADRICASELVETLGSRSWNAGRRGRLGRVVRLVSEGIDPRLFARLRAAARALPASGMAHGDFYYRNVLPDGKGVCVLDWEYLGPAPVLTDHLRFWSALPDANDRERVLTHVNDKGMDRGHIAVLGLWLAYRLWAENASAPRRRQNPRDLAHARRVVLEAEALWGSPG